MDAMTIVWVLLAVVIVVAVLRFLGKTVSMAFSAASIIILVWLVVSGLQYMDQNDIREKFLDSNNLFVLKDGSSLISAYATKEGLPEPDLSGIQDEIDDPDSELYDDYYKVILVDIDTMPSDVIRMISSADEERRLVLFQDYVYGEIIGEDIAQSLVEHEKEGDIVVYQETIAFRHGTLEVLGI